MRVRIDIGLDFEGNHTFDWQPSEAAGALDVPKATLERWAVEREAFKLAYLRWKRVVEEIEDALVRADERRRDASSESAARLSPPALAVVAAGRSRARHPRS